MTLNRALVGILIATIVAAVAVVAVQSFHHTSHVLAKTQANVSILAPHKHVVPQHIFPVTGKPLPPPLPAPPSHIQVAPPAPVQAPQPAPQPSPQPNAAPNPYHGPGQPKTCTQVGANPNFPCGVGAGGTNGTIPPGFNPNTGKPDGNSAQQQCAKDLAAGKDTCSDAPPGQPGLGLPPDQQPSA